MLEVDTKTARRLFLHRHALLEPPVGQARGEDLLALIKRLGFVQLDSINTFARAHDLILAARRQRYRPSDLKRLYERDRGLFEHWTHDAAVIPIAYYPHWHLRFSRDAELLKSRWSKWRREGFQEQFDSVLTHIRDHGPVCSAELGTDEKKSAGGWWDWHPSKTALEYLWRSGALAVVGRDGFQKRYDLTERVIGQIDLAPENRPEAQETIDWLCNAALDRLGFATSGELAAFWDTARAEEAKDWVAGEKAAGRLMDVCVTCADGSRRNLIARPDLAEHLANVPSPPARLRVLSPFDPALRDRKRAERLFGFHYRIEVFTPAPKRKYGYYVFPVLERDKIIGRVDMKADRTHDRLHVRAFWPERGVRRSTSRMDRWDAELERCRRFADLGRVSYETGWWREAT